MSWRLRAGLISLLTACSPSRVRPLRAGADVTLQPSDPADLVYLIMVDRFANGDPSNDKDTDRTDPHGWHGGDLQGVRDHLDHLEALGVKTVWLTPVTAARDEKVGEWGAFHGYWLSDPWTMNPRFGTVKDLRALSDDLHARGMRLVVDMVWNHTDYDAPARTEHPDWYHQRGDIDDWDDPVQRVTGDVHGLPDLAQENPAVRDWLQDASLAWVDRAGLDGMRIDAVGHMPRSFLAHMNATLDAHAQTRGNPGGVWTLAEDFTGDPLALAETVDEGGFDAIFDFALHYALVDVACRDADPLKLASTLSLDRHGPPPSARVTFLDNHDLPRVASVCGGDDRGAARRDAALLLLFTLRGTPCLTWGTEAASAGAEEPENRAGFDLDQPGSRTPLIAELSALRAAHPALIHGTDQIIAAGPGHVRLIRTADDDVAIIDVVSTTYDPSALPPLPMTVLVKSVWWAHRHTTDSDGDWIRARSLSKPLSMPPHGSPLAELNPNTDWTVRVTLGTAKVPETSPRSPEPHILDVTIQGAPDGGSLRLVGADPALGGWKPTHAVLPVPGAPNRFQVTLQDGDIPVFKPILVTEVGDVTWSPAPDRTVFLHPDRHTSTVEMSWSTTRTSPAN